MASVSASLSLFPTKREDHVWGMNRRKRTLVSAKAGGVERDAFVRSKGTPGVDTRIHWDNPDEGWLGVKSKPNEEVKKDAMGEKFADLMKESSSGSLYQFLGVPVNADIEEIKAAYRRLSKEYHPDTTSLPLETASYKFMQLREAYDMLSDDERRRFYDWTLAQEIVSRQADREKLKLEDPYEQDLKNWQSVPDMVDRLGGKNMELSDQALTALSIDAVILVITFISIIYALCFKEQY